MASHDSAIKKNRQDVKRRLRNRQHTSRLRSQVKKMRGAIDTGKAAEASGMLKETLSMIDRSAKLGVIHKNAAARSKSRLTRALATLSRKKA
jgi:small subunit ribosomal protein S20